MEILKKSAVAIGCDDFQTWVRDRCAELARKAAKPEDVSFRKEMKYLNQEDVLEVIGRCLGVKLERLREKRRNSILRPVAARMLVKYCGLTNRQTADILSLKSGVAVGLQGRKIVSLMANNSKIAGLITTIEEQLEHLIFPERIKSCS